MQPQNSGAYTQKLWHLPAILKVSAAKMRYRSAKLHYVGRQLVESPEAVEILVQTANEFPVRALSPVLYIGTEPVIDYTIVDKNKYLFFAFDFGKLQKGAPISIGWQGLPSTIMRTNFRYTLRNDTFA